jgi:hypothetical protein
LTPVQDHIEAIAARVDRAEAVSAGELVAMLGKASYPLIVLVLSVLNMIPGPPGYGGSIAVAIISVTVMRLLGRPIELGGWIGRRHLPRKLLDRMVGQMRWLASLVSRVSRPRWPNLTGPRSEWGIAVFILVVSLPMLVPIPFINAVPNTGIAILALSRINADGLGVVVGITIALIGVGIAIAAISGGVMLVRSMGWL